MKFIKKHLKVISIMLITIGIIGGITLKSFLFKNEKIENEDKLEDILEENFEHEQVMEEQDKVYVDIKGAVVAPGVYEIETDKKVIDVVTLAGGLKDNADTSMINLAKKVTNEMVVIIYTKEEVALSTQPNQIIKYVDKQCICPEIKNDACLNNSTSKESTTNASSDKESTITNEKVNLNTATSEQLQTLSGIGESKAKAIIEYRETNGEFKSIEELKEVSGIGDSLYEKVKDNITV